MRFASEFGDGANCVLCLQRPLPLTLTNDTVLGEIILVSFDGEKKGVDSAQWWLSCVSCVLSGDTHTRVLAKPPGPGTDKNTTFYLNYLNQY